MRVLLLGDSLTQSLTYPMYLQPWLRGCTMIGTQGTAPVNHEGYAGKTFNWHLSNGATADVAGFCAANGTPDVVAVLLGTNDVFPLDAGTRAAGIAAIRADARAFVNRWAAVCPQVFVVQVPNPNPYDAAYVAEGVDKANWLANVAAIQVAMRDEFTDHTVIETPTVAGDWTDTNVAHPATYGYAHIADFVYRAVRFQVPHLNTGYRRINEDADYAPNATAGYHVHHADLDPTDGSFSACMWFRAKPGAFIDMIRHLGASGLIARMQSGVITLTLTDLAAVSKAVATTGFRPDNDDYHLLYIVRDNAGAVARISVDDYPESTVALGLLGDLSVNATFYVGLTADAVTYLTGWNDAIWWKGKAVSRAEVLAHFYDGTIPTAPVAPGLRYIWRAVEGAGTAVVSSPAGMNLTLVANTWTAETRGGTRPTI